MGSLNERARYCEMKPVVSSTVSGRGYLRVECHLLALPRTHTHSETAQHSVRLDKCLNGIGSLELEFGGLVTE